MSTRTWAVVGTASVLGAAVVAAGALGVEAAPSDLGGPVQLVSSPGPSPSGAATATPSPAASPAASPTATPSAAAPPARGTSARPVAPAPARQLPRTTAPSPDDDVRDEVDTPDEPETADEPDDD